MFGICFKAEEANQFTGYNTQQVFEFSLLGTKISKKAARILCPITVFTIIVPNLAWTSKGA